MFPLPLITQVPFIRAHGSPVATPPVAAPVAPSPVPPTLPPNFSALALPMMSVSVGVAVSSTTIATLTGTAATVAMTVAGTVPGLTFTLSWAAGSGTVSVAGTPAAPSGIKRVFITYTDGAGGVLGSSIHEFQVINPAELFRVLTQLNLGLRQGWPVPSAAQIIATLSFDGNTIATAHPASSAPGVDIDLTWTRGSPSTGTLKASGTPTSAGSFPIVVEYHDALRDGVLLGSSTHTISVDSGAIATPPAPAPAPAPAPPAPSPPAAPAPAPRPLPGSDDLLGDVVLALDFTQRSNAATWPAGLTLRGLITGSSYSVFGQGMSAAPGASGEAAWLRSTATPAPRLEISSTGQWLDLSARSVTLECMVRIDDTSMWSPGAGPSVRLYPVASINTSPGGTAGGVGAAFVIGFLARRRVMSPRSAVDARPFSVWPVFIMLTRAQDAAPEPMIASGPELSTAYVGGYFHLAGQLERMSTQAQASLWWDRKRDFLPMSVPLPMAGVPAYSVRLGVSAVEQTDEIMRSSTVGVPPDGLRQFFGAIDELRVTRAARYTSARGITDAIPAATIQLPWPTY